MILSIVSVQAQESIKVNLYKTTQDYVEKNYTHTEVTLVAKKISDHHIHLKKFIDDETGKKMKEAYSSWAIEYNGNTYFNLGYSSDLNNWFVFIKLDYEGKNYCASFIGSETPAVIKNSGGNYGGGLTGALIKDSSKWGKSWENKENDKVKILFIDLTKQKEAVMARNKGSLGDLLTKKDVNSTLGLQKSISEIKGMSFEEVVDLIIVKDK